ncbi:acyltransferase [Paraburkholderia humisilvae]|uniref:2,3,4,5-tetrahydropyridine-2,6-dicarboxylate N-acetyltransferase n=1 Tax=Paraburkholderia humisilvae TaxID=627669 RepID=A0A6J5F603_9BURK|nr:acyltransferase [Paraburkholderia humisilvae]CAB3773042.1 2,3,4,5-tetrahydropyridine-2,6-dicarboxylate N-acetyltransferase [Paraburkholderia humisilvae]
MEAALNEMLVFGGRYRRALYRPTREPGVTNAHRNRVACAYRNGEHMLRTLVNWTLSHARPGKQIADEVGGFDLMLYVLEHGVNLLRGLALSLRCKCAAPCFVGRHVRLRFGRHVEIGRYATIGDGTILSGLGRSGLYIGERTNVGAYSRLVVGTDITRPGSYIHIGAGCGIGEYSSVGGSGGVSIGENTIIGQYFSAHPENHNFDDLARPIRDQGTTRKPIKVGEDCWLGARVTVVGGVTIGGGSVIAAGTVVTHDVPPYSIVAGIPARVVGSRKGRADGRA